MPKVRTPENLVEEMPLRKLVGQTMALSMQGSVQERQVELIKERHVGTLILPPRCFKSGDEVRKFTGDLQVVAMSVQPGIPSFIGSEQEPGLEMLPPPATSFPTSMALTASKSARYCYDLAFAIALELRSIGVNMNLAPMAIVNQDADNPRSIYTFGEDPTLVAKMSSTYVRGLQHGGISAVAKYFPLLNDVGPDAGSRAELKPFSECIRVGVDAILLGGTEEKDQSRFTPLYSRTVSLLRNKLGFRGLVVADLRGIADPPYAREALIAGNDLVIVEDGTIDENLECVISQAKKSRIFARRTKEAALRMLRLKFKRLNRFRRPSLSTYGAALHSRLAQQIANDSITAVRSGGSMPMKRESPILLVCPVRAEGGDGPEQSIFFEAMRKYSRQSLDNPIHQNPTPDQIDLALDKARRFQNLVICSIDAHINKGQADLIQRCLEVNPSAVLVSLGNPYDLRALSARNCIATYGYGGASLRAAAAFLFGQIRASGTFPIALS